MAKGKVYQSERAIFTDPRSGLRIIRLTHYSTISMNCYFEMCSFTEDERYVVVLSQREAGRDAPWDLMRVRTDGMELVQLTECNGMAGMVVCPKANAAFYHNGARELLKVDLLSLEETVVAELPAKPYTHNLSFGAIDEEGKVYFSSGLDDYGNGVTFRVDLQTGKSNLLFEGEYQNHHHVDPQGSTLYFGENKKTGCIRYLVGADGANLREYKYDQFAHHTWLGRTGLMQGCLLPPGNALVTYREGDPEHKVLASGRYYWHSSASRNAEWIVADTNWPREGIFLLHVPTGNVSFVCDPQSSCSHPQWTHPHPCLSQNMRFVFFNSDLTGVGQTYLAELTPEFLAQAAKGYAPKPCTML